MFSLSRVIAGGCTLAFTLTLAIAEKPLAAQATAQDTAHRKGTMPMNMPMGKRTQKKKSASKTGKIKRPGTVKKAAVAGKKSTPSTRTKRKMESRMAMPGKAMEHHVPQQEGQMQMPDTAHHMRPDSARGGMGAMQMHPAPATPDSMKMPGMPGMPGMDIKPKPADSMRMAMPGMSPHTADDMMIGPVGISMERMGSGTTWIPDAVTLPSRRRMFGNWMVMAHGFVFAQYDKQTGERGDEQFGSLNWTMLMATRDLAGGRFQARTMLSLDPLTVTKRGYPLLLQTGESYKSQPLHDRQHPHDFWMELGAMYEREITKTVGFTLYGAPSGEPALGPVAFMHRARLLHWCDGIFIADDDQGRDVDRRQDRR